MIPAMIKPPDPQTGPLLHEKFLKWWIKTIRHHSQLSEKGRYERWQK